MNEIKNECEKREWIDTGDINTRINFFNIKYPSSKCLIGQKFERLMVLDFSHKDLDYNNFWICKCDCGILKTVRGRALISGGSKSCGCFQKEKHIKRVTKHGCCGTRTYKTWEAMKCRCLNPNYEEYHLYGGKGVKICKRWINSFENFLQDMGDRPLKMTIDRIDGNKNYSCGKCEECLKNGWKSNCRWSTDKVQARNTNRCRYITFNGDTKCVAEWAETLGITKSKLHSRLESGWSIKDALTIPTSKYYNKERFLTFNNRTMRLFEWAKETGISRENIKNRLKRGWTVEKALTTKVNR